MEVLKVDNYEYPFTKNYNVDRISRWIPDPQFRYMDPRDPDPSLHVWYFESYDIYKIRTRELSMRKKVEYGKF
jgi:hypothetical protein